MTDKKVAYIMSTLDRAKVSILAFSKITKISRTTLHQWKRGRGSDLLRLELAYNYATRINKAVEMGKLPIEGLLANAEGVLIVRRIIAAANKEMR